MVRLTGSEREEAIKKIFQIETLRKQGLSEEEIAKRLNFTSRVVTDAGVMHGQL